MSEEDVFVIKDILQNRIGTNKFVFRDENGKLDPIVFGNISIVGLFVSGGGILWLVDNTEVKHDMFGDIRPWYFHDKYYALTFPHNCKQKLLKKLGY
jgi:hypothetical protein